MEAVGHEPLQDGPELSVSVVSHGQLQLVRNLVADLAKYADGVRLELLLTLNLPEELPPDWPVLPFPVRILRNSAPMGFGANHNQAFREARGDWFAVVNPDIRLRHAPWKPLFAALREPRSGLAAPLVVNAQGAREDSVRRFPKPWTIVLRALGWTAKLDYPPVTQNYSPDWVAGMFMVFPQAVYRELQGFDTRYFLYYEDVDICARLHHRGWRVVVCPSVQVQHEAQRASHKKLRYLRWHVGSVMRFFCSRAYWALHFRCLR